MKCVITLRSVVVVAVASLFATSCGEPTAEGTLEIGIADDFDRGLSWNEYWLHTSDGRAIALEPRGALAVRTGARVRVTGDWLASDRIGQAEIVSLDDDREVAIVRSALLPPPVPAVRRVAAVVFNFADLATQPITTDEIRAQLFTGAQSAKAYYLDTFYGWMTLEGLADPNGDVFGYYTIPSNSSPCNQQQWGTDARAAALAAGVDLTRYDHVVHFFPRTSACSWGGYGQSSGGTMSPTGNFNYGRYTWVNSDNPGSVTNHEFGHNFRMSHSSTNNCTDASGARVTFGPNCTLNEYGSRFDVMGSNNFRHSNAYNKGRAGVMGPPNILTVRQGGIYPIQPLEKAVGCGTQAIRIARTTSEYYYIDYHQPIGIDSAYAATAPIVNGVLVYLGPDYTRTSGNTKMLDMTPGTTTFDDAPLVVGQTYTDPDGVVSFTLESRDGNAANVRVQFPGGDVGPNLDGCSGTGGSGGAGGGGSSGGTSGAAGAVGRGGAVGTGTAGRGGTGGGSGAGGAGGTGANTGTAGRGGMGGGSGAGGATAVGGRGGGSAGAAGGSAGAGGGIGATTGAGGASGAAGGATGIGGTPVTAGVAGGGGMGAGGATNPSSVSGGCSCQTSGSIPGPSTAASVGLILAVVPLLRRRRSRGG